jgi:hypothetical protein
MLHVLRQFAVLFRMEQIEFQYTERYVYIETGTQQASKDTVVGSLPSYARWFYKGHHLHVESASTQVCHEQTCEMTTKLSVEEGWMFTAWMEVGLPQYEG